MVDERRPGLLSQLAVAGVAGLPDLDLEADDLLAQILAGLPGQPHRRIDTSPGRQAPWTSDSVATTTATRPAAAAVTGSVRYTLRRSERTRRRAWRTTA